ncbi:MAG: ferrous iron transport protein A [Gemmatimonadales bacterium]
MAGDFLTCPFCGFEFSREDTLCHHGCPLGPTCRLIRCPNCAYEYPEKPQSLTWWGRLFGKPDVDEVEHPARVVTARELTKGERATVLCVGGPRRARQNALALFGIVPGAEVVLLQHRPSCVIRIGETELALDPEIAREILVERVIGRERSEVGGSPPQTANS